MQSNAGKSNPVVMVSTEHNTRIRPERNRCRASCRASLAIPPDNIPVVQPVARATAPAARAAAVRLGQYTAMCLRLLPNLAIDSATPLSHAEVWRSPTSAMMKSPLKGSSSSVSCSSVSTPTSGLSQPSRTASGTVYR